MSAAPFNPYAPARNGEAGNSTQPAGAAGAGERTDSPASAVSHHTPGPWEVESSYSDHGSDLIVMADQCWKIADCRGGSSAVALVEEAEANARLIAAAPELLSALECALATMDAVAATSEFYQCGLAREIARTAIAKAVQS